MASRGDVVTVNQFDDAEMKVNDLLQDGTYVLEFVDFPGVVVNNVPDAWINVDTVVPPIGTFAIGTCPDGGEAKLFVTHHLPSGSLQGTHYCELGGLRHRHIVSVEEFNSKYTVVDPHPEEEAEPTPEPEQEPHTGPVE